MHRLVAVGLGALVGALGVGVAPAAAASVGISPATVTAKGTRAPSFGLTFDKATACSVAVSNAKGAIFTSTTTFDATGLVSARVVLPPGLVQGRGKTVNVVVSCDGAPGSKAQVIVPKGSPLRKGKPESSLAQIVRRQAFIPTAADAASQAHARWQREGANILASFHNGPSKGQCGDWVITKRPDLVQRVTEARFVAELLQRPAPPQFGNAENWGRVAAAAGMTVSPTPVTGAAIVWQPGVEGAGVPTGHVGYVESVSPDGKTFAVSEMNVGEVGRMGYRTLSTTPVAGRVFILP